MKYLKTFENFVEYTNPEPINFEEVFGFSDNDLRAALSDFLDKYDFLDFELLSDDYKNFKIEFFDKEFSQDTTQDLKDEYQDFEDKFSKLLEEWFQTLNVKVKNHELDSSRNRIVVSCKLIN